MLATISDYHFEFEKELELFCLSDSDTSESESESETVSETESEYESDDSSTGSESSSSTSSSEDSNSEGDDEEFLDQIVHQFKSQGIFPKLGSSAASSVKATVPSNGRRPSANLHNGMTKKFPQRKSFNVYVQQDTVKTPNCSAGHSTPPNKTLMTILDGVSFPQRNFAEADWANHFLPVTQERIAAYSLELTKTVRSIDLETLKTYPPEALNACNRHGESLMNIVCRRNDTALLEYVLSQGASLRVRDDYGKTPLHDACWTPTPNFGMIKRILQEAPWLLFVKDRRGFTPLDYVPRDIYEDWNVFLLKQKSALRFGFQYLGMADSRERLEKNLERLSTLLVQHAM